MNDFYNYIRTKFQENSEFSGRPGDPIDDLAVKPTALTLVDFYNLLVQTKRSSDITRYKEMSDEELDLFGSRTQEPRVTGETASVVVRIYFDYRQTVVLDENIKFVSLKGQQFICDPTIIDKDTLIADVSDVGKYYIDINCTSIAPGSEYKIGANEITSIIGNSFVYKYVTNPEAAEGGSAHENNDQYAQRLKLINDRSMFNRNSIISHIKGVFPEINSVYISGSGDKYMTRDLVSGADNSIQKKEITYLGKKQGNTMVKHRAFYGIFPPNPDSYQALENWGYNSPKASTDKPITIDPLFFLNKDASLLGFPLEQEADDAMYEALYFQDVSNNMIVETKDIFNIEYENVGPIPVTIPDKTWKYGANGFKYGYIGTQNLSYSDLDFISFYDNVIEMSAGSKYPISVQKSIGKRTGLKMSGIIIWPDDSQLPGSSLQLMVGGIDDGVNISAYTGIGFGIITTSVFNPDDITAPNASIFFANSVYGNTEVMISQTNLAEGNISLMGMNSLAETPFRIEPGIEYDFEFFINDDLTMSLYLNKKTNRVETDNGLNNELNFFLPRKFPAIFSDSDTNGILSMSNALYGSDFKISLNTNLELTHNGYAKWYIKDMRIANTTPSKPMALFAMDIKDIKGGATLFLKASGIGVVNKIVSSGYNVFLWNKNLPAPSGYNNTALTQGSWELLDDVSDPNGTKYSIGLLSSDIDDVEQYIVDSIYGQCIFVLVCTNGNSQISNKFNKDILLDQQSQLFIDYIKLESKNKYLYHANNKCDIFVSTFLNSLALTQYSVTLNKDIEDPYYAINSDTGFIMPINELYVVYNGRKLNTSEYSIVYDNDYEIGSINERIKLYIINQISENIEVFYYPYKSITNIQNYFNSKNVYGDILIKHKRPCFLNITIIYYGNQNANDISSILNNTIDGYFVDIFDVKTLNDAFSNNNISIKTIIVKYDRANYLSKPESGEITNVFKIDENEFFKIKNLTIQG